MVKDIRLGTTGSFPANIVDVGGIAFFTADDGTNGVELWRSNGTSGGTFLLKNISTGTGSSTPQSLTSFQGRLYFSADEASTGRELWTSDGTAGGTVVFSNVRPEAPMISASSSSADFTALDNLLFFAANVLGNARAPWVSDGSTEGTRQLALPSDHTVPSNFVVAGDAIYFGTFRGLIRSDGTDAGTVLVKGNGASPNSGDLNPNSLVAIGTTIYFVGDTDPTAGTNFELWKSDGTTAGTVLVKDIFPGVQGSLPQQLTNVNGTLFFSADDGISGRELWKSDGTAVGTVLVKDIRPGVAMPLSLDRFTASGGLLFFAAEVPGTGNELWKSDGTAAGTALVKDVFPGSTGSISFFGASLIDLDGLLLFDANDGVHGRELWTSDGTAAGTVLLKDIHPTSSSLSPVDDVIAVVDGIAYFPATDGALGTELWQTDGTEAGTVLVKDILPGASSSGPMHLTVVDNQLYFTATDGTGRELWASDGTATGTVQVADFTAAPGSSDAANLADFSGTLVFTVNDQIHGNEPWLLLRLCGDGTVHPGEDCDDANLNETDGCNSSCQHTCGDGMVAAPEECDDGNELDGDCCSSTCTFEALGTSCSSDGTSCTADACDGAGTCTHLTAPATMVCRGPAADCDAPETCNGFDVFCPADADAADGTGCGDASDADCDHPDTCQAGVCIDNLTAAGAACTDDTFLCTTDECNGTGTCTHPVVAAGVPCRAAADVCDAAESCNGIDPACPPDGFAAPGTGCGDPSNGPCDHPDSCNGLGACSGHVDPNGTACGNPSNSDCDHPDTCSAGACVINREAAGTPCGSAADTDCTDPDTCTAGGTCAGNDVPNGTSCGSNANTDCDNPDTCSAGACISNAEAAGTSCTPDASPCTLDQCNGSGSCAHPAGHAGTECRSTTGVCDVAEQCDGISTTCPVDGFAATNTPCGSSVDTECSNPDSCDGNGVCLSGDEADGTSCDDSSVCTQVDECQSGTCSGSTPIDCDDGSFCTIDSCDPLDGCLNDRAPASGCKTAQKSLLQIKHTSNPDRDKLTWKWQRGDTTTITELGNPTGPTTYGLCIFDGNDALISDLVFPAGPVWSARGSSGFKYRDITYSNGGAQLAQLKAGDAGRTKALAKGRGSSLDDPPLGSLVLPLTVQLRSEGASICFENSFGVVDVQRNDAEQFKAKK